MTDVVLYANGTPLPAAVAASPHMEIKKSGSDAAQPQPPTYDVSTLPDKASPERSSE